IHGKRSPNDPRYSIPARKPVRTPHTHLNTIPEGRSSHLPAQQPDRRDKPRTRPPRTDSTETPGQPQHTHTPLRDLNQPVVQTSTSQKPAQSARGKKPARKTAPSTQTKRQSPIPPKRRLRRNHLRAHKRKRI